MAKGAVDPRIADAAQRINAIHTLLGQHGGAFVPVDPEVLEREAARRRLICKRLVCFFVILHLLAVVLVNGIVWAVYAPERQPNEPYWPHWVTFGTCISLAFHLVSVGPILCQCPCSYAWFCIAIGNLIVVNFAAWGVWWLYACGVVDPQGGHSCKYYCWPKWVSLGTGALALVLLLAPILLQVTGVHEELSDGEIDDEVRAQRRRGASFEDEDS